MWGSLRLAPINEFGCDPLLRGFNGRSLLHDACEGGNAKLVQYFLPKFSLITTDALGNTPLHTCVIYKHAECVEVLLAAKAPILLRNGYGKTPLELATGRCKTVLEEYLQKCSHTLKVDYNKVHRLAAAKYTGENPITRVFVLGHPGAGKSSLIESLKKEGIFKGFGKTVVGPHTAGIVPSSHTGKQMGRVLFFDFAGDPEYYSSHAAILESHASAKIGQNLVIIIVNMNETITFIERNLHYWYSFIEHQKLITKKLSIILLGSHLDQLNREQSAERKHYFESSSLLSSSSQSWTKSSASCLIVARQHQQRSIHFSGKFQDGLVVYQDIVFLMKLACCWGC